jgi:hypothetical protein
MWLDCRVWGALGLWPSIMPPPRGRGLYLVGVRVRGGKSGLRLGAGSRIFWLMSPTKTVVCSQCDKPERDCRCDKYCCICAGFDRIKLGEDGLYYCPECMEACDVKLATRSGM